MVSKSSYDELMQAYEQRGALLFEAIHLLNKVRDLVGDTIDEEAVALDDQVEDFLSRGRQAGMA